MKDLPFKENLGEFLDSQYNKFNATEHLKSHPDPLIIVYENLDFKYLDELAFICACYAYGNAGLIIKNLRKMPFFLLESSDISIIEKTSIDDFPYYRFQTRFDTKSCFLVMHKVIESGGLKNIFLEKYNKDKSVLDGIRNIQVFLAKCMDEINVNTRGLNFLFGNPSSVSSPLKRINMFLRWMVRKDSLDLGRWSEVDKSKLLLPLDTHTFRISKKIGLCNSKTYSLKSVLEITTKLAEFCSDDPVKYDFALYRIGQLGYM